MEGQVRGLQQMVEDERYCLDVVQQVNALSAAAREVALSIIEAHLGVASPNGKNSTLSSRRHG